ncbi:hypothetical protein GGS20DRAFT_564791 [Poronia punctata]|nr:hypothetical protein GGS20DRAFT_564791 [Poronia punctata]
MPPLPTYLGFFTFYFNMYLYKTPPPPKRSRLFDHQQQFPKLNLYLHLHLPLPSVLFFKMHYLPLLLASTGLSAACTITTGAKTTFYGVPDNDPAGSDAIAFSCGARGYHAGGTGTYDDPLTFASRVGSSYGECEIVYAPYLKKYIRNEDTCAACDTGEWVDVFTGNSNNGGDAQVECENRLTPDGTQSIIRDPARDLEVDETPLFSSGTCNTGNIYPNNNPSSYCGGNGGGDGGDGGDGGGSGCQTGCSWEGHCQGCSCSTYDDCSDDFICTNGVCA